MRPRLSLSFSACLLLLSACSDSSRPSPAGPVSPPAPPAQPQPQSVTYEVTFDATWRRATHPVDIPSNPHFSPLVGGTHDARVVFWSEGRRASEGIERMAEMGRTTPLDEEIGRAIANGTAGSLFIGVGFGSPGRTSLTFVATQDHPLVTLVSMVAPSPDWFVGVNGLDLFAGGRWAEQIVVPLYPWDAGTDNGATFTSADAEAQPHLPVSEIRTAPLAPTGMAEPLGTFTFRRTG